LKLKKIKFNNHKILNNLEVNFCDDNMKELNTVVIIGENGAGKTTLLRSIFNGFEYEKYSWEEKKSRN